MMSERDSDRIVALQLSAGTAAQRNEDLPFAVELWDDDTMAVERVIARASSNQLARAIFGTAQKEFPGRRITVRRDAEILLDSERT